MPDPTTPPTTDTMHAAVRSVDEALSSCGWASQPTVLLHLATSADGETELGMAPLDGHPVDALIGTVAPDSWDALGMSQLGWARTTAGDEPRRRVRVTTLLSRTAEHATLLRDARSGAVEELGSACEGRVSDVLHRCLGLSTPPPCEVPEIWFAVGMWVGTLALAAATAERPLSWAAVVGLHPVEVDGDIGAGDMAAATAGVVGRTSWEDLRWQTVEGRWMVPGVPSALASWFDAGSFARWIRSDVAVVEQVAAQLVPDAALRLHAVLDALDLGVSRSA